MIKDYLSSLGILNCPSIKTTPVTDPANTRAACYYAYDMFAGRGEVIGAPNAAHYIADRWPDFGLRGGVPENMDRLVVSPSLMPMTQDRLYFDSGSGNTGQSFVYNHGNGSLSQNAGSGRPGPTDTTNPSHGYLASPEQSDVGGSNIAFYDGHARWYNLRDMDVVGGWHAPPNGAGVATISKLPSDSYSPVTHGLNVPGAINH
jgi:prepilin-type processing-associated H-X9-DG protein